VHHDHRRLQRHDGPGHRGPAPEPGLTPCGGKPRFASVRVPPVLGGTCFAKLLHPAGTQRFNGRTKGVPMTTFLNECAFLLQKYGVSYLRGAGTTLLLALVGTLAGCLIGFAVGTLQTIPIDPHRDPLYKRIPLRALRVLLRCYVELFRGTPMMIQAVFIYYGLMQVFNIHLEMWTAGFLIVSINTGAYMAETVRGGIVSIDPGQTEGAMSIGMTHWQTMLHVIMPQALRNIVPQIGNNFTINIKDTSVMSVISITDLFFVHKSVVGAQYTYFETATIAMLTYLTMTLVSSYLLTLRAKMPAAPQNYNPDTTETLAYTSGMYNAPDPDHKSQNLDMKEGASHV